jgi:hypothetical protein
METTELIKVKEFTGIMQEAPDVLRRNQLSVQKSNDAGQVLLDTIEGGGMNDALDSEVAIYLKKIGITAKNMEERRKPITQIFDQVRKIFTQLEGNINIKTTDTIPGKLVDCRNTFARKKLEEERKRKEEQRRQAAMEQEKATFKADIEAALIKLYDEYFNTQSHGLLARMQAITFDNYNEHAKYIRDFPTDLPDYILKKFDGKSITTCYLSPADRNDIGRTTVAAKSKSLREQFTFNMEDLRQSYIDRLPSKKKEVEEAEQLRRTNAQAASQAAEEKKKRDEAERLRLEIEEKGRAAKQVTEAAAVQQMSIANSLFDAASATIVVPPVKAKVTEKILVTNQAGFLQIYQMWWTNEGQNLAIDELTKIHKKMITFCEKMANKEDKHIESQFVKYEEDIKAK